MRHVASILVKIWKIETINEEEPNPTIVVELNSSRPRASYSQLQKEMFKKAE